MGGRRTVACRKQPVRRRRVEDSVPGTPADPRIDGTAMRHLEGCHDPIASGAPPGIRPPGKGSPGASGNQIMLSSNQTSSQGQPAPIERAELPRSCRMRPDTPSTKLEKSGRNRPPSPCIDEQVCDALTLHSVQSWARPGLDQHRPLAVIRSFRDGRTRPCSCCPFRSLLSQ